MTLTPEALDALKRSVSKALRASRCPVCGAAGFLRIHRRFKEAGRLSYCRRGHPYYVLGLDQ